MHARKTARKTHQFDIVFSDEKVTSFGGMVLEERFASRLGLWTALGKALPGRRGKFSWLEVIRAGVAGLLTGGRGTFATQEVREDRALLELLGLSGAPEEATFWRCLEGLGEMALEGRLGGVQMAWVRRILATLKRVDLLECRGFFPLFPDGSLLEGSRRREGTTYLREGDPGLMWVTIFAGPLVASQAIGGAGEGEETLVRRMLPGVVEGVLKPLRLRDRALFLADSLHGDGPSLDVVEGQGLRYVVGAGKLSETNRVLRERTEGEWHDEGHDAKRRWTSALCLTWADCEGWAHKRLLVGRRVVRDGELFPEYHGVMTNLSEADLGARTAVEFMQAVWSLYDAKGRMELGYQELLSDLGLHHPPCQKHVRNSGFYALATLAHTLGVGLKLVASRADEDKRREHAQSKRDGGESEALGGEHSKRGGAEDEGLGRAPSKRDGVPPRVRVKPRRRGMRLWRVARRLFAIPARVTWHARRMRIEFLGVSAAIRSQFERWHLCISRC